MTEVILYVLSYTVSVRPVSTPRENIIGQKHKQNTHCTAYRSARLDFTTGCVADLVQ